MVRCLFACFVSVGWKERYIFCFGYCLCKGFVFLLSVCLVVRCFSVLVCPCLKGLQGEGSWVEGLCRACLRFVCIFVFAWCIFAIISFYCAMLLVEGIASGALHGMGGTFCLACCLPFLVKGYCFILPVLFCLALLALNDACLPTLCRASLLC